MDQVTIIPPPLPVEHLRKEATAESDPPTPVSPAPQSGKFDAAATVETPAATGEPAAITATAPYALDTTATAHGAIPDESAKPAVVGRVRIPRDMWNEEEVAGRVMAMLNDA